MKKQSQYSRSAHYPVQKTITRIMKNNLSKSAARVAKKGIWHHSAQDRDLRLKGHLKNQALPRMKQPGQRPQGQPEAMQKSMQEAVQDASSLKKACPVQEDQAATDSKTSPRQASKPSSQPSSGPSSKTSARPSARPASRPSSGPSPKPSTKPSAQQSWEYWRPSKEEMVEFVVRAILRCRQLRIPLSELTLPCLILAFSFSAFTFLVPGTASASYEEHLAGEIVSRTHTNLSGQIPGQTSGQISGQPSLSASGASSGSVLSLPCQADTGMRQQGLKPGLEEHGRAHPSKAGVSGKNVPLKKALAMLVPPGWTCTGTFPKTSSMQQGQPDQPGQNQPTVSWKKKEYWHEVLRRTALEQKVHMTLDWQEKTIAIREADAPVPGSVQSTGKALSGGRDSTPPAQEARPGDPGIISLAPLPDSAPASQNLKQAPGEPKAQPVTAATDAAHQATAPGATQPLTAPDTAQPVTAAAAAADPVQDALASARKDSSAGSRTGTLAHPKDRNSSQPSAASGATTSGPSPAKPAPASTPASSGSDSSSGSHSSSAPHSSFGPASPSGQFSASGTPPAAGTAGSAATARHPARMQAQTQAQTHALALAQPAAPSEYWQIAPGSLRMQLESWAGRKGITLVWKPDTDLELETGALFEGSFESAVRTLFEGLKATGSPYAARLYHGNNVLIVEDR